MAKIGRNDLCPCGSGKKYKRCCMANDELAAREKLAANAAAAAAAHQPSNFCDDCAHQLDDAADAVFDLIDAKKFDEAEQAGDHDRAIEYYRRVIAFAHDEPHLYDPQFVDHFQDLIGRLEPRVTAD
jgi:hypothetical protein